MDLLLTVKVHTLRCTQMLPFAFLAAAAAPCPSHLAPLTSIADFGVTYCFELKSSPASCDGAYFTRLVPQHDQLVQMEEVHRLQRLRVIYCVE